MTDTDQAAAGLSYNGVNVYGDEASIEAVRSWLDSHSQVEEWRRSLPDEITRLRAELAAAVQRAEAAERKSTSWFDTHIAHRQACDALGKANGELLKRALEAEAALAAERAARERIIEEAALIAEHRRKEYPHSSVIIAARKEIADAIRTLKSDDHGSGVK